MTAGTFYFSQCRGDFKETYADEINDFQIQRHVQEPLAEGYFANPRRGRRSKYPEHSLWEFKNGNLKRFPEEQCNEE